jgi:menaquinone-dependent protoporphyrinogen oxidase
MKALVAVASKYGATEDIARAIGAALAGRGVPVEVKRVDDVGSLGEFEAVVVGSGIYAGRWLKSARSFVDRFAGELVERKVWLFSSGPIGDPPQPPEENIDVGGIASATGAIEHRVFGGKLAKGELKFADRAIAKAIKAPDGDFRDWTAIETWSAEIAEALAAPTASRV